MTFPRSRRAARAPRRAGALALGSAALLLALAPAADARRVIIGSPGPDRLVAKSAGGDTLFGGGGPDTLIGGPGPDRLYGVRSDNDIRGGGGNDYIEGGAGSDKIDGGAGNNTIYGSSGHDVIRAGDGNNYVDVGGAPDTLTLGNGDNVVHTGSGGLKLKLGSGDNTVYHGSGALDLRAGNGVNLIYINDIGKLDLRIRNMKIECGSNPASKILVPASLITPSPDELARKRAALSDAALQHWIDGLSARYATPGCPRVGGYGPAAAPDAGTDVDAIRDRRGTRRGQQIAEGGTIIGTDGPDKLLGGHDDVVIDGKGGDNEIWADRLEDDPGNGQTAVVRAGDGRNRVFGGRGTNTITLGNGDNFVRGGAHVNTITLGSGSNIVRLQGAQSTNTVVFNGRRGKAMNYVEAFGNGRRTRITCKRGAKAVIVHGNVKPRTNCGKPEPARTRRGQLLQVRYTPPIDPSAPIMDDQIEPGERGIGVRRP